MTLVQFIDGGWEVFDKGIVVTHYIWEAIFEENSPFEIYTKSQCEYLLNFCRMNSIDYEEYYEY